jgi:hypothetical protein
VQHHWTEASEKEKVKTPENNFVFKYFDLID